METLWHATSGTLWLETCEEQSLLYISVYIRSSKCVRLGKPFIQGLPTPLNKHMLSIIVQLDLRATHADSHTTRLSTVSHRATPDKIPDARDSPKQAETKQPPSLAKNYARLCV